MKFALVEGTRQEPQTGLSGHCPNCGQSMVAKCGRVRVWHWAHKGRQLCDPWWENETPWHRAWKNQFPPDWQEVIQGAPNGERHIADVKTFLGWVLEFQHSNIRIEERESREHFYSSLMWVVDGTRRLRDVSEFVRAWENGKAIDSHHSKRRAAPPEGALLREWTGSKAHVFFDFGEENNLWWLFPDSDERRAYLQCFARDQFLELHRSMHTNANLAFNMLVSSFRKSITAHESPPSSTPIRTSPEMLPHPLGGQFIRRRRRL